MTEGVDADIVRCLNEAGITSEQFFSLSMSDLSDALGKKCRFENIKRQEAIFRARQEWDFITSHSSMRALFIFDDDYPVLLREIPDAPVILYVVGDTDLNKTPAFSVVGTRRCSNYGVNFCKSLVKDLAAYFPAGVAVSGLAYGIDAAAHSAALEAGLATFAVLANGLDMIYPAAHRDLARRIVNAGGALISEYPSGFKPFQRNFLQRNRIIAGLCELTFVVESDIKGGAMSTANQAFSYSREVMALPGRFGDRTSAGCNRLIAIQKAHIFTGVADLISLMQWKIPAIGAAIPMETRNMFPELEADAKIIYDLLRDIGAPASIDEIHRSSKLPMSNLMSTLTELEFEGIILKLPGSRFELA